MEALKDLSLEVSESNTDLTVFTSNIQSCLKDPKYSDIIMDELPEDLKLDNKIRSYNALRRVFKRILERGCEHEEEVKSYIIYLTHKLEELRQPSWLESVFKTIDDGKLMQDLIVNEMNEGENKPFHSLKRVLSGLIDKDPVKYEGLLDACTRLDIIIDKIDSSDEELTDDKANECIRMLFQN